MIRVRVPATSANLGPGFDCMGLALDLWNTFDLELSGPPGELTIDVQGEGADSLPTDRSNCVYQTLVQALEQERYELRHGVCIRCDNEVPCISGLGSSSTAIVAGLAFAHALSRGAVNLESLLNEAVAIEGHGDNVGPAIMGGLMLIMPYNGGAIVRSVPFVPITVTVCVPDFVFLTTEARACLPESVPRTDAVFNLGRAMFVLQALRDGDDELLQKAMADRIHEQYRLPRIPGAVQAMDAAKKAGALAVCLSGAGPGIIAFASEKHNGIGHAMIRAFEDAGLRARHWVLTTTAQGTCVSIG